MTKTIKGLKNIGNTCFMNAVFQCLFNTPSFNDHFLKNKYQKDLKTDNKGIATAYAKLIQQVR